MYFDLTRRSDRVRFSVLAAIGLGAIIALAISGCQTSRIKDFESVHGGMSKGDVLAAIGNPQRTQRWHGRDRWQYTFYGQPEGDVVREVHFENGKSTYVGGAIKPAVSADEQDRINDIENLKADLRDAEHTSGVQIQRFEPVKDSNDEASLKKPSTPGVSQ